MKNRTLILLMGGLFLIFGVWSFFLLRPGTGSGYAQVISEGKVICTVNLHQEQTFPVTTAAGGRNVITVQEGKIAVTQANCPDHYCIRQGFSGGGRQIVCLPNRLVIRFLADDGLDGVVG